MSHPRRELLFPCSRRKFLPALFREALVTLGMLRGGQGCRLSDLGDLSDEQLAQIKPIVNPTYKISVEQDRVLGKNRETGTILELFSMEETEKLFIFNLFNGKHSLGEVGELIAQETGWDEAKGFVCARDLFFSLVRHLVVVPNDPVIPQSPALSEAEG